ncbi:MAG: 1,4-alpha-glucan branching enzyme GlgB [Chlamydiae bacterium]|nr:1,4-alpha-glucan branching enzyme GlgB [Chlamydiota bacterium]
MQEDILELIGKGHFTDPHEVLGLQSIGPEKKVIRMWRPDLPTCILQIKEEMIEAKQVHTSGLFEVEVSSDICHKDYLVFHPNGEWAHDPYAFGPLLGELDNHLFSRGLHYELYDKLGSRVCEHQGVIGTHFALWAPNARSVSVVGHFNRWDGRLHPMRFVKATGLWEIFVPGLETGEQYLFELLSGEGKRQVKADPLAHYSEVRPGKSSIVCDVNRFAWSDGEWIKGRGSNQRDNGPLNIYEVHLGSWKRKDGEFLGYREVAHALADYCKEMHYTHVELIGVCEHPLDESWGYQVSGYFAPTSRHGSPGDFQYLINHLHRSGVGVILDWVPAHFPADSHSLSQFDGTYLYEHRDPRQGYHPQWNTHIFNYGRWEVSNFLIASALFWLEKMHIDGLRIDAVASMLQLDFGRKAGEWIPNKEGSNVNLEAVEFLKHLNSIVHTRVPDALMIAEDSTSYEGVTTPVENGGLGFDYKWNLGWMNDTLEFFEKGFSERDKHLDALTKIIDYTFMEKYVLVLSHDEVVHEKRSLFSKMPGTEEEKFAGLRLLLSYMITFPGKKLLFMGGELGQPTEWNCKEELPWDLLESEENRGLQEMIRALNAFYLEHPALFAGDFSPSQFTWAFPHDKENLLIGYYREGEGEKLLTIHNLGPHSLENTILPLTAVSKGSELFNTDREEWGGSGRINQQIEVVEGGVLFEHIPPLSTLIVSIE